MRSFLLLSAALFASQCLPARADDTVVFAADEADLHAFDKMLAEQESEKSKKPLPNGKAPFGQAVKEQAELLRAERPAGNAMGAWVREQRRKGGAQAGESAAPGKSAEARGAVHGNSSDSAKGGQNKGVGKGKKN